MPRWSPCQAPLPSLFTSFVAMLHLGNDMVKTLASPGEGVDALCTRTCSSLAPSRTSLRCASLRPSNSTTLRVCGRISTLVGRPPFVLFFTNDTRPRPSAIAFVDAQYSASAQDLAVDFCHTLQFFTPTLPKRNPHRDTPSLAVRGDGELGKRVQTAQATHHRTKQLLVWNDATRSCPLQFRSLKQ